MIRTLFVLLIVLFLGCSKLPAQLKIELAFPNLTFEQPVDIQNANDGTNRLFIVSQPGKIYVVENSPNVKTAEIFLDITEKVLFGGEQGLLGLAFHPDFKNNGYFFVNYTTRNPRRTIISRFEVSKNNPNVADKNSELVLMQIEQPYSNHNGGQLAFGPDGYLYISLGDGGSAGDPQNNAQNLRSHLGKILRIDVNNFSQGRFYSIPHDNPFRGNTNGLKEEIYAWGLRNVWRFSFDKITGKLWAADVGQNLWEEIDIIEKGKNYGWRIMEGFHCYNPMRNCDTTNLTMPIWEYGHNDDGGYSITGGFVYRGNILKELYGKYIYADFVTGNIWALDYDKNNVTNKLLFKTNYSISTFGIDEQNELYFADYAGGKIYKFVSVTGTNLKESRLYDEFDLYQNYPNPFNLSTIISFILEKADFITLKVYDILGKELAILINEIKNPGIYNINFNGMNYPSGIYFYSLFSSTGAITKKMVMIK
ncbi:MAG: PQQ-dependent sugar dehydrogenase [Melioribacter sp.]|nr:PQQ-dependent sugar dehydrogenase [Melioribacter sp.]